MANEKRLIDAKPLMENGWHLVKTGKSNTFLGSMSLADVPTVDAVEVVHGRWVRRIVHHDNPTYWKDECSICGFTGETYYQYCPNCGAKMDGGNEDAER